MKAFKSITWNEDKIVTHERKLREEECFNSLFSGCKHSGQVARMYSKVNNDSKFPFDIILSSWLLNGGERCVYSHCYTRARLGQGSRPNDKADEKRKSKLNFKTRKTRNIQENTQFHTITTMPWGRWNREIGGLMATRDQPKRCWENRTQATTAQPSKQEIWATKKEETTISGVW